MTSPEYTQIKKQEEYDLEFGYKMFKGYEGFHWKQTGSTINKNCHPEHTYICWISIKPDDEQSLRNSTGSLRNSDGEINVDPLKTLYFETPMLVSECEFETSSTCIVECGYFTDIKSMNII